MRLIESPAELCAHAIAVEREAAKRYGELALRMHDEDREDLARLFDLLAREEAEHLEALERKTQDMALPEVVPGRYNWLDTGAPEGPARGLVYRLMTPRQALAIALRAEQRSQAFFEHVYWTSADPALRELAAGMAAEEREHVALVGRMLSDTPEPTLNTTLIFER